MNRQTVFTPVRVVDTRKHKSHAPRRVIETRPSNKGARYPYNSVKRGWARA